MLESNFAQIWIYLATSPLLGLTMTLVAYSLAYRLYVATKYHPLLNPVVTAVGCLILFLLATDTSYQDYFAGGQYIHFLLGPATVALAIPLYQQWAKLSKLWMPVLIALIVGGSISGLSSVIISRFLGASLTTQLSLAPKSVTAPVAMAISEQIGGLPSLTAALVVITGIFGALIGTNILTLMGIRDDGVRGVVLGITAHGMGTARSFQISSEMGAFAGLAMALSAFISSLILPWLLRWVGLLT